MKDRNSRAVLVLVLGLAVRQAGFSPPVQASHSSIVISQVYGGGGNTGATLRNDFIELFNRGTQTVSLAGWSMQYTSATGTGLFGANATLITELPSVSIAPGHYLLIQEAQGTGGTTNLPSPDVIDATPIAMAATAGKVALVNATTPLGCNGGSTPCSTGALATIVDLVGYGSANFFEGTGPTPAPSNTTAALRAVNGCTDTDNNSADFAAGTPNPRNSASAANSCPLSTNPSGTGAASPSAVAPGETSLLTVAVTPGSNPTSSGLTVKADLSAIGGSATQEFLDNGTGGDAVAGDLTFSYQATVSAATAVGDKTLPATIRDAQLRTGTASISLAVLPVVEIHEIQGNGLASPYAGRKVRTEDNVVTAVFNDGFFIQTPASDADADAETSNGIFVFTGTTIPTVEVGDRVDVEGTVAEFFNMTEITSPTVRVDFSGVTLPAPVTFDSDTPSPSQPQPATEMERFEGMLVRLENGTVSSPTNQFGEASVVATSRLPFREPGILFPGLPALPVWDGNPEVFEIDTDHFTFPAGVPIPRGATVTAEGPLAFSFSDYQIWPTSLEVTAGGQAQVIPVRGRAAGEFTVGSQNFLRLFDTADDPDTDDPLPTPQRYADRLAKFSLHVRQAMGAPDVLAVQEAENLGVLEDLADKIHHDDPALTYAPYLLEGNDIGGIDVGFLVRDTVRVDSVEQFGRDDTFVFNNTTFILNDRPPLVLRGAYVGNGAPFPITVIAVHQRSLGGIEGSDGPRVRAKRHEQALRLSQFIQSLQGAEPGLRLVAIGDFNAFEFTDGYVDVMGQVTGSPDPAGALIPATDEVDPDLTNQTLNLPAVERYSFVFDGSAQSLDHAVTSLALDPWVRGTQHSRGNADAPFSFDQDATTSLRSSDHDGTVVYIMSDSDGDGLSDDRDACSGTQIPESVPTVRLGVNHFALVNGDGLFDTTLPAGRGPGVSFTVQETAGCSCEQIIDRLGLGHGQTKHGCSIEAMQTWVESVSP